MSAAAFIPYEVTPAEARALARALLENADAVEARGQSHNFGAWARVHTDARDAQGQACRVSFRIGGEA